MFDARTADASFRWCKRFIFAKASLKWSLTRIFKDRRKVSFFCWMFSGKYLDRTHMNAYTNRSIGLTEWPTHKNSSQKFFDFASQFLYRTWTRNYSDTIVVKVNTKQLTSCSSVWFPPLVLQMFPDSSIGLYISQTTISKLCGNPCDDVTQSGSRTITA